MIVEGLLTGMHRSPYQGFAIEFAQHRQYTAGDDIRRLDWKVFGRTDKLYLKQYEMETNLDLILMVDASGSMGYAGEWGQGAKGPRGQGNRAGSSPSTPRPLGPSAPSPWTKYDHAATIAASLAYATTRQQDRVGLVVFDDHVVNVSRMSNSHDHWRGLVDMLTQARPSEGSPAELLAPEPDVNHTDLARVFDQVLAKLGHRSLVVLISDLFDDPAAIDRALARLNHRRHDLILLQTLDHDEITFPFRDTSDFIGLEAEGKVALDPAAIREAYLKSLHDHLARIAESARRFRFDHLTLDTSESLAAPLSHFLAKRAMKLDKR